jgi:peptidyl-prolyl cis-trans isomerase D
MTMLDRMRRHRGWLKWSLALVVLTFVVFFIPNFTSTGAAPSDVLAEVEGTEITVREFQRRYSAQLQAYRNAYGSQLSEQLLRQLGIEQQIMQQLVDEQAMVAEARRQGMTVGDEEIRARILAIPAFQENGRFIGETRYRQMLQFNNPPMTPQEFEDNLRKALLVEKLRVAVTGWMTVTDAEVADEFRRKNEKVKLDVVPLTPDAFKSQVTLTDTDVADYFDKSKDSYQISEKRKIRYALVDVEQVRQTVKVPEADIEAFYKQNIAQYSTPEQIRANHILLKTEGKDEAAVKTQADALAKRAKSGDDFAALAKEFSEDESNNARGGDLDYFGRGTMVSEFEDVAFKMKAGDVSDPVKTSFGFHIIKLADHRPATTRPLTELRTEIEEQLKWQKAQADAEQIAKGLEAQLKTTADLDRKGARLPRAGHRPLPSRRADRWPGPLAGSVGAGVLARRQHRQPGASGVTRLGFRDGDREAGSVCARARRSARQGPRRPGARTRRRDREDQGRRDRGDAEGRAGLCRRGEEGRARGEDD